jgi:enediyne polyketide synthase
MKKNSRIAIVGMDCKYPGASNIKEYWENILALRQQFRNMPKKRLNLEYYGSEDANSVDTTYVKKAAVLTGYEFDRIKYRVSKSTFEQTDMAHWLALDVAAGALKDAGFENGIGLPKDKVGVIIGNSLNGEFTRANIMRLRWPYVFKVLESTLLNLKYETKEIETILQQTEKIYKEPFPVPDADTLAGGLSNTISGRICNYFDFNGGGYTVDGACSSSLLALTTGCNAIINDELEMALIGGVDVSIDPFEMIGFARNGALAKTEMEVFGKKPEGFWPGEGCGMIVIMKEEEAIKRGLNIYATICGWGISSDGKGGITRPKPETQQLALRRAYERASYNIDTVTMFEAHGTGTPLGDEIELTALTNELKIHDLKAPAIVGSVKHLIGHTKAAAGIAGVIKAALAAKNKIVPPSMLTSGNHNVLNKNKDVLKVTHKPLQQSNSIFRTGVSSFGFGGINVHITMEGTETSEIESNPTNDALKSFENSPRDFEIFPITATNKEILISKLEQLEQLSKQVSRAEFLDLSNNILQDFKYQGNYKASFVVSNSDCLQENITTLISHLETSDDTLIDIEKGIYFNLSTSKESICFLFPGQGAPIYKEHGAFSGLNNELLNGTAILDELTSKFDNKSNTTIDTSIAQPLIVKNSVQSIDFLNNLGINATYGIGHSLGEISALSWANIISKKEAVEIAEKRGHSMSQYGKSGGAMIAVKCNETELKAFIQDTNATITGYNGKDNYVLGGTDAEITEIESNAFRNEIKCTRLKVSHAFHTPLMTDAALHFKNELDSWKFQAPNKQLMSTVTGDFITKTTNINSHLYEQIEKPVKFTQAINSVKNKVKIFIELGPGDTLQKTLRNEENLHVVSLNYGGTSIKGLLNALAASFIFGTQVQFKAITKNRFFKPFHPEEWKLEVLENPCEKIDFEPSTIKNILNTEATIIASDTSKTAIQTQAKVDLTEKGVLDYVKQLISDKTEIPVEVITDEDKIMSQLHLNSLVITEIVSLAAKAFNKSHKVYSEASILANDDGTIRELSTLIFEGENGDTTQQNAKTFDFSEFHNWTHIFKRINVPKKRSRIKVNDNAGKIYIAGNDDALGAHIKEMVHNEKLPIGNGGIFIYNNDDDPVSVLRDYISFLKKQEVNQSNFSVLIECVKGETLVDLKPVFRSFIQEYMIEKSFTLTLPSEVSQKETIFKEELEVISKYKEILYDTKGVRFESQCELFFPEKATLNEEITQNDVIVATGGGKGITFESILHLGIKTKATLAIIGRSKPENDKGLQENLNILTSKKIKYKYYEADVCDEIAVKNAVKDIYTDFGKITMILHGAGINNPKRIKDLTETDVENTQRVKIKGLKNVVKHLNLNELRFIIGYGSIIAQSGMQGNADYAFANDQLAIYLNGLQQNLPNCRCITFEWSVWDETGMGANLNSIRTLKDQGVWPIPVKNGIEILESILADKNCLEGRYIISGRYGTIPTLIFNKRKGSLDRFTSKIKFQTPGVEVVTDVPVNLNDDVYLQNHVFNGQYVFPTVMILEGMSQCCNMLNNNTHSNWVFENLQIHKSIFIPKDGINTVRFIITRISETEFKGVVQSEDSNYEANCFEAMIKYDNLSVKEKPLQINSKLEINTKTHFYDDLLFHHGPFRRISSFYQINALGSLAQSETNLDDKWFGEFMSENKSLGDPGLNDAAIHCHQACRPAQQLLPIGAKRIVFNRKKVEGPLFIQTHEKEENGNETTIDVLVMNKEGVVQQSWTGLILTKVTGVEKTQMWISEFLVPYLEYQLNKVANTSVTIPLEMLNETLVKLETTQEISMIVDEKHEVFFTQVIAEMKEENLHSDHVFFNTTLDCEPFNFPVNINIMEHKI